MFTAIALRLQQSLSLSWSRGDTAVDGLLLPGQAQRWQAPHDGTLRVLEGRLWATRDGPHRFMHRDQGDQVLSANECLMLNAGQWLVLEAWATPVRLAWEARVPGQALRWGRRAAGFLAAACKAA